MNRYIVTLDISSYDDSGDTHSLSRLYKTAGPVQIIVLEGYNFIGWYTDEEFSIEYDDTTQTIEDYTIYGKYEEIE